MPTRAGGSRSPARTTTESASTPGGPASPSGFSDDCLDIRQEGVAIHDSRHWVLDDPLLADHSLPVDQKERPDRDHRLLVEDPVGADDLPVRKVAEQRVRQLQGLGERLLRERRVGADAEDLDTEVLKALVVGLPGRQVRRAGRREIRGVKLEEHELLALEVAQRDARPSGTRQREAGRRLADLHRCGGPWIDDE